MKKYFLLITCITVFLLAGFVFTGCDDDIEEPPLTNLINILSGSPGFSGDQEILGLRGGERYLIKHARKEATQERDPEGRVRIFPMEDWYAVDSGGGIVKIASSTSGIPNLIPEAERLNNGTSAAFPASHDHKISGLLNGENYSAYFYGEAFHNSVVVRLRHTSLASPLATFTCNSVLNLRNLIPGNQVMLADNYTTHHVSAADGYQTLSQVFNDNNHMIVLVGTPLYFHEEARTSGGFRGANIRIRGYDYDIIVQSGQLGGADNFPGQPGEIPAMFGLFTVDAIERDGQQFFVLTAGSQWRGKIRLVWHDE
jgi:hypothetical protein